MIVTERLVIRRSPKESPPAVVVQAETPTEQGTVNSIDAGGHKLNITHGPVAALNWPGMTMVFKVAPRVEIAALKPGAKIPFVLELGVDGAT